jgi:hypothetical protein
MSLNQAQPDGAGVGATRFGDGAPEVEAEC